MRHVVVVVDASIKVKLKYTFCTNRCNMCCNASSKIINKLFTGRQYKCVHHQRLLVIIISLSLVVFLLLLAMLQINEQDCFMEMFDFDMISALM